MVIRIAGVTIPNDKKIDVALTYIYGIGVSRARKILEKLNINPEVKAKSLKEDEVNVLREEIEKKNVVEGDLRREIASNIKRLKEIGSYRGQRHSRNLPVRGQRTKTNSRTVRGNKRSTMGSGKVKAQKT
ncbi:MAG: 30S ribosomal protein S13 [Patescibacteria group bacterium]|jgi:small subunit ribosomal protein S13|nr:30S ribosomal protein S13 [Patescibacteria group bacterium]